jgi:propanol-preferring alcohol dehydrogenase
MVMLVASPRRVIAVDISEKLSALRGGAGAWGRVEGECGRGLAELTAGVGVDVAVDFVSSVSTLEASAESLGKGGRLVTLGGYSPQPFRLSAARLLTGELEVMGSRSFTTQEIIESLELCARGQVWPLVTETYRLEEAEKVHARLEEGSITGRAAIVMG